MQTKGDETSSGLGVQIKTTIDFYYLLGCCCFLVVDCHVVVCNDEEKNKRSQAVCHERQLVVVDHFSERKRKRERLFNLLIQFARLVGSETIQSLQGRNHY